VASVYHEPLIPSPYEEEKAEDAADDAPQDSFNAVAATVFQRLVIKRRRLLLLRRRHDRVA
jgi:hypothetical protein